MGMIRVDGLTLIFKLFAILSTLGVWLMTLSKNKHFEWGSEFYFFLSVGLLGMLLLSGAVNLLMIFLCLEIISLISYLLTAYFKKPKVGAEAAVKYFIYGSVSSAIQLYGISLLYGISGTLEINDPGFIQGLVSDHGYLAIIALLFWGVGLAFKLVAVPFHFWSPDVYEGAPTLITALMSTLVKIAAFAAFYKLVSVCFVFAMGKAELILTFSCAATLLIGNLVALVQDNFKRLLAYSGISHAGYMMLAILSLQGSTDSALFLYSVGYAVASLAAFAIAITVFKATDTESISGFNGLGKKNPFLAACLTIAMLSLAGIPPFAGFFGKYFIFSEAFRNGYEQMVFLAIISSIIGVFYYMKVIVAMYSKPANEFEIKPTFSYQMVIVVCLILSLVLGLYPGVFTKLL
jgi:NADH-quinone oxidoreductase subunit N